MNTFAKRVTQILLQPEFESIAQLPGTTNRAISPCKLIDYLGASGFTLSEIFKGLRHALEYGYLKEINGPEELPWLHLFSTEFLNG